MQFLSQNIITKSITLMRYTLCIYRHICKMLKIFRMLMFILHIPITR